MKAAWIALACVGCIDSGNGPDGDPHGVFELVEAHSWTLPSDVIGMDSDGANGAWVIFKGTKTLVHLGPNAVHLADIPFDDENESTPIAGLAFGGDRVWVSYEGVNNTIRTFDATTGAMIKSFGTETGIADLDVHGNELRYSVIWDVLVGIDAARGGENWRKAYDGNCCGIQRGIASMDDELVWVSTIEDRVFLVDRKVGVIGSGKIHLDDDDGWFDIENSRHLGWDGQYVMIQQDNRIFWLEPQF